MQPGWGGQNHLSLTEQDLRAEQLAMPIAESLRCDSGYDALLRRADCPRSQKVLDGLRVELAALLPLAQTRHLLS